MKIQHIILLTIAMLITATSCNKEKPFSKKLMKGEKWNVKNITVNGTSINTNGIWHITTDVDIYDSVPSVKWIYDNQDAIFEWQFQDKGKTFQLNYVQQKDEVEGDKLDSLDYITYRLTGKYSATEHKRKSMIFASDSTIGYPNKTVEIFIEL